MGDSEWLSKLEQVFFASRSNELKLVDVGEEDVGEHDVDELSALAHAATPAQ